MANPNHPRTSIDAINQSTTDITISLSSTSLMFNANPWRPSANDSATRLRRHWKDFCTDQNMRRGERGEIPFCGAYGRDRAFEKLLRLAEGTEEIEWRIADEEECESGGMQENEEKMGGLDGEGISWYKEYEEADMDMEEERDAGLMLSTGKAKEKEKEREVRKDSKDIEKMGLVAYIENANEKNSVEYVENVEEKNSVEYIKNADEEDGL